ncbi:zinc ribbon domain-containing protein [Clostridium perfringens]|uniref:zinc ribbon domain-containing protein n=1 Tax=Clostridium perfringens TaxID=1502 RepID=UPI001F55D436|nr:zinc ribbon domain-containing protein [Clostridium perfringens]MCI2780140.1 zinc ribbon domain-containing protein [Clostridium perfringens]MCX0370354.1 zinc ribbon domain-containing protein [Clostridium perfringens]MDK0698573.1 zinc ribbon domain-containing protein [Clostridium perfringens]
MWCINCGTSLPDEAKFCFCCGYKMPDEILKTTAEIDEKINDEYFDESIEIENIEDCKEVVDNNQQIQSPMIVNKFRINMLGRELEYSEEQSLYALIENTYDKLSKEAQRTFLDRYNNIYNGLGDLIDDGEQDFNEYINRGIAIAEEFLKAYNINSYDKQEFYNVMKDECTEFSRCIYLAHEFYYEVMNKLESERNYREVRKEYRGRWQGGGFGFEGAIKGAAKAGIMNFGTGILHSMANGIGNMSSNYQANSALNKMYNDEGFKKELLKAIESDIMSIKKGIVEFLEYLLKIKFDEEMFSQSNINESIDIYNSLTRDEVDEENIDETIIKLLTTYPLDEDYYYIALKKHGEYIQGIDEFAKFFNVSLESVHNKIKEEKEYERKLDNIFKESRSIFEKDLEGNVIFNEEKVNFNNNLIANVKRAFKYFDNDRLSFIYDSIDKDTKRIFNNALESYLDYEDEVPLVFYNNSTDKIKSEGFMISNKNFITHNDEMETIAISIESINEVTIDGNNICINSKVIKTNLIGSKDIELFRHIVEYIVFVIKNNKFLSGNEEVVEDKLRLRDNYFQFTNIVDSEILKSTLGEVYDIFEKNLRKNRVYNAHKGRIKKDLSEDLNNVFKQYEGERLFFITNNIDAKLIKKLNNVYNTYASTRRKDEKEFFIFDNTVWGGAKEGFYITDEYLYCHNSFEEAFKIKISEVDKVEIKNKKIYINDKKIDLLQEDDIEKYNFKNLIEYILFRIKYDNVINQFNEDYNCKVEEFSEENEVKENINNKEVENKVKQQEKNMIREVKNETELLTHLVKFLSAKNIRDLKNRLYINGESANANKKIVNASKSYLKIESGEFVYALYDNTIFGSGKDGFSLTNKNIYYRNCFENTVKIPYKDIETINIDKNCLIIERNKIDVNFINNDEMGLFRDTIIELIEIIKNTTINK